jgi:hypothetical protein
VYIDNRTIKLTKGRLLTLTGGMKPEKFEARRYEDDFYRWSGLRSGYLAEASVDAAQLYAGSGPGWYGPGWVGMGWYWSPWYGTYTFLPVDGVYYGPFGWPYYSPIGVYNSPFIFYGHAPHRFGDFHHPYGHGLPAPGRAPLGRAPAGRAPGGRRR